MSMASSYDGWNFYDDGSMVGPQGQAFDAYGNVMSSGSGLGSLGSDLGDFLKYAGKVGVDTWAKTSMMQQAQSGQRYIEGQRYALQQQQLGGIPPVFLLIGGAVLFAMMLKG